MKAVLDASALLAWMQDEPGAEAVESQLVNGAMSSLNWSEVLQKSLARGVDIDGLRADLEALGLTIVPFDAGDAEQTARLWARGSGLSLADRACLALGVKHGVPVWTADRQWAKSPPAGIAVHVIRE